MRTILDLNQLMGVLEEAHRTLIGIQGLKVRSNTWKFLTRDMHSNVFVSLGEAEQEMNNVCNYLTDAENNLVDVLNAQDETPEMKDLMEPKKLCDELNENQWDNVIVKDTIEPQDA